VITFTRINNKSYFLILFCSVICVSLLGSSILPNAAFGQNTSLASPSIGLQQQTNPKLHLVKITSPIKGEQVPVGKDLSISGTSVDKGTSGCKVSVKVNFVNPYHDALPIAEGAQNNSYSKWNFTLTSAYTSIQPGQNKIIAKFSCADNPNLISKATVNVTGVGTTIPVVATANTTKENNNNTQQQVSSIAAQSSPQPTADRATPLASSSVNNATTTTTDTVSPTAIGNGNENTDPKALSASIHFGKNSIHPGDTQTITVKVSDKNSANTISGASVTGKIIGPSSGILKNLEGTTDNNGVDTYSWKTSNDYTSGKYELNVDVSYQGYSEYSTSKIFKVTPLPVTSTSTYNVIPHYSSNIISSYPYSTDTNTYTDTNTNHYHHSKIISSYPYSTHTDTDNYSHYRYYSHNDHTGITTGGKGLKLGMGNLAQKIINDVKSKFKSNWIQFP
jgi:hypothetical protein